MGGRRYRTIRITQLFCADFILDSGVRVLVRLGDRTIVTTALLQTDGRTRRIVENKGPMLVDAAPLTRIGQDGIESFRFCGA
jgi:hypothetical protein